MSQIVRTSLVCSVVQSGIAVAAVTLPLTLIAQDSYRSYASGSGVNNHAAYIQEARARYTNPYVPASRASTGGGTFRLAPGEALATSGEYVKQFFGDVVGKAKSLTQRRQSAPPVYSQAHIAAPNTPKRSTGFSPRSLLPSFGTPPRGAVENPTRHGEAQGRSPAVRRLANPDAPTGGGRVALDQHRGPLPEPVVRNQGRRSQSVWAPETTVTKKQTITRQSSTEIPRLPIETMAPVGQAPQPAQNLPVPPEPITMENPQSGPRPTLEQAAPKDGYLVGTDSGKPGRVLSPYPPHQELDVTGIARGDLAIDPVANKIFRIP